LAAVSVVMLVGTVAPAQALAQAPAGDPYARYATPWECSSVAPRADRRFWRPRRPDTAAATPLGAVRQAASVAAARACVARFTVDGVAERDLLGLGAAALAAGMDARADSAFQRLLRVPAPAEQRAWWLASIVDTYTDASPARIADARRYLAQLDAMGAAGAAGRLLANLSLAQAARRADSVDALQSFITGALAASRAIAGEARQARAHEAAAAFYQEAYLGMRRGDGAAAVAALERGQAELTPIRPGAVIGFPYAIETYRTLGRPAPVLRAARWMPDSAGGAHPTPGVPELLIFGQGCGGDCYPGYTVLRRVRAATERPLDVVLMLRTVGSWRDALLAPDDEIEQMRRYFLDERRLPVAVGVWRTEYRRIADGRLRVVEAPNERAYRPSSPPILPAFLVDGAGRLRFITHLTPADEAAVANVVREMR